MRVNKAIIIKLVLPKRNKRNQKLKQNQVATKESQLVVLIIYLHECEQTKESDYDMISTSKVSDFIELEKGSDYKK